jgi:hypothetical protein
MAYSYAVNAPENYSEYPSIAIGVDGVGIITYIDFFSAEVHILHCGNRFCNPDY